MASQQNIKPYPWTCAACGKRAVEEAVVPYAVEGQHYRKQYLFTIPELRTAKCESCGEIALTQSANAQISAAVRKHLGLLTPDEIRAGIEARGVSQKQLAKEIDVAPETLSRWLSGMIIPSRKHDVRLREKLGFTDEDEEMSEFITDYNELWMENVNNYVSVQEIVLIAHTTWGGWGGVACGERR